MARVELGLSLREDDTEGLRLFEYVAQDYLDTLEAKRSTHLSYENILNRYWLPAFSGVPINEVRQRDIKITLAALDVSPKTKKNILIPLRGVFAFAEIDPNPVSGIRLKKHQKPKVERYLPHEREALLGALQGQAKAYFALLFATGVRPGEALGLTWADYDGRELEVSKQVTRRRVENSTKTSVRRRVFVPTWCRPLLNALPSRFAKGHLFVNSLGTMLRDTDDFNTAWMDAHRITGIPYRIPYTCRHTRAAELLTAGIEPADAARQLGHSVEMFLRTYSEFMPQWRALDPERFDLSPNIGATKKEIDSGKD